MRSFPRRLIKHSSWRGEHPQQHAVLLVPLVLVLLFVLHLFLIFIVTAKNCWDSLIPFRIFSTHFVSFMGSKIWSWGEGGGMINTRPRLLCLWGWFDDWRLTIFQRALDNMVAVCQIYSSAQFTAFGNLLGFPWKRQERLQGKWFWMGSWRLISWM